VEDLRREAKSLKSQLEAERSSRIESEIQIKADSQNEIKSKDANIGALQAEIAQLNEFIARQQRDFEAARTHLEAQLKAASGGELLCLC
jgi:polyhydroxyalkanoate synthesis regulator phasin